MDINAEVADIVAQASEWNFAGDCALLELMKRISQNLHESGERTSHKLKEFETNVRRVDIALDNATNSLRSLQFGQQFVEYRVEEVDDDDFVMPEEQNKKPELPVKSSQEMANEFLQNNLRMFRKNFEPVTIELPDSDDEDDGAVNTTTVFRAKNPYDSIPLPYIIGSKQWQEHKYAGLYDSAENSEDEHPEQFSSSSSDELETATTAAAAASAPKPTPRSQPVEMQQSDSSSLASLPQEPISRPAAQPIAAPAARSQAQPRPIISSQRNPHESDLFQALRASPPSDDPPSTSSSLNSSPAISHRHLTAHGLPRVDHSLSSSSSSASKPHPVGRQSPPKLFDEPITVAAPIEVPISQESEIKPAAAPSQIKRKPVNLFNDDEFDSFMSEIVDKVKSKSTNSPATPATVVHAKEPPKAKPAPEQVKPIAPAQTAPKETPLRNHNLFDESPPLTPTLREQPKVAAMTAKKMPTSLFDDNLDDDVDDFLSAFTPKAKPQQQAPKISLFDDDDDDLDIDDIFAKKMPSNPLASKMVAKTSLFDDDDDDNANDIFSSTSKPTSQSSKLKQEREQTQPQPVAEPPNIQRKSLFDDIGDDDLFGTPKSTKQLFVGAIQEERDKENKLKQQEQDISDRPKKIEGVIKTAKLEEQNVKDLPKSLDTKNQVSKDMQAAKVADLKTPDPKSKADLFSDDFSDEEAIKGFSEDHLKTLEAAKDLPNPAKEIKVAELKTPKPNLFSDDFSDEEAVEGFARDQLKKPKIPKDLNDPTKEIKGAELKTPKADIFSDNFSDEEAIKSSSLKNADEAKVTNKITKPIVDLAAIKTTEKEENGKLPAQLEPTNKKETDDAEDAAEEVEQQHERALIMDDLFDNLKHSSAIEEHDEDPIISLVADVSNNKSKTEIGTPKTPPAEDIAAAQQIMQNYSSLFSDEPPDDSEFFQSLGTSSLSSLSASKMFDSAQDFFEPNLPDLPQSGSKATPAAATSLEQSNKDYGGMHLFSDVPPEDDDDQNEGLATAVAPLSVESVGASTKRIHTIFYDDFSETARAGASHQIIDEPPPIDIVDKSASEPLKLPSPIKKLQMPNININVKALLPGGGALPKLPKKQANTPASAVAPATEPPPAHQAGKSSSSETDSILQCISKTRVRGPAHRRPSTRRARQENYAKTLLKEQPDDAAPIAAAADTSSIARKTAQLPSFESDDNNEVAADAALVKPLQQAAAHSEETHQLTNSAKSSSFLDSDSDDDALFGKGVQRKSAAVTNTGPPKSYVSFLDNNGDDDNFLFSSASVAPAKPSAAEPQIKKVALKQDKLASSFFNSDDDDDDALFKPAQKAKAVSNLPVKKPLEKEIKSTAASISLNKQQPAELVTKSKPKAVKPNSSKLFDDSDDDDDLFGSASLPITKTNPKHTPIPAADPVPAAFISQTSVFSSSSSEEEKLPKSLSNKSRLPTKPSKSLFSDDDDDDDLFGGGAGVKRGAVVSKAKIVKSAPRNVTKKVPSKITATPLPASAGNASDNPLADLLDP
ncbi:GH21984 [Drosophila grimshawi]|uniref:GH21984 n=1 Tax=Drosophila grimshawi TaxID=7222 RepID=B4J951_DROGR|nr:GH21984 [Drosophila grimshawi]